MTPVKKVEIIVDSPDLSPVLEVLDRIGVSGYTVIRNVSGKGGRGVQRSDDLTDVFANAYIITACPEEEAARVIDAVRPLLKRSGGVCMVSDVQWLA